MKRGSKGQETSVNCRICGMRIIYRIIEKTTINIVNIDPKSFFNKHISCSREPESLVSRALTFEVSSTLQDSSFFLDLKFVPRTLERSQILF